MRRKDKQIQDTAVLEEVLQASPVGNLGTNGYDGYPRVKPLNFAYENGHVYFHSALEGEKIEDIRRDDRVCFSADVILAYVKARNQPCEADYLFRSVIVKGRAHLVEDPAERVHGLELLMRKYQPGGRYGDYPPERLAVTGVVRIDVEEMTGKEHLRDGSLRETALELWSRKSFLPPTLER